MNTRMTKVDWDYIAQAVAFFETYVEDDPDVWASSGIKVRRLRQTHRKVWERKRLYR